MMYISHQELLERELKDQRQLNRDIADKYARCQGTCQRLEIQIRELREQMNAMKSDRDECFKRNEQLEIENAQLIERIETLERKVDDLEDFIRSRSQD